MKKIVFLIIASLLVIGLVLPGCEGEGEPDFEQYITFGVAGPMDDRQGEHHWAGAEMARDAINDGGAGGIDVGGTIYGVDLVEIDTNEVSGTPSEGVNAMNAHIGECDFIVGGFRTEAVTAYQEVAMEAEKIFMNCGAATGALQYSVIEDYDTYKYWFKATPYNEIFLIKSLLKMTGTIGGLFHAALVAQGTAVLDDYEVGSGDQLRVAIIAEALTWADGMVGVANLYLPGMGYNVTITKRPSATATDITTELGEIEATKPHIILTIFSGPVGLTYSKQRAELDIPALSLGINVEVQSKGAWLATNQGCLYDIMLDTWAEDMEITPNTVEWFDAFVAKTGDYPVYNAATYDAMFALKQAIEATASLATDDLIPYIETNTYTGVGATTAYYPMPAYSVCEGCGPGGTDIYGLNETQVTNLYDLASYGWSFNTSEWYAAEYTGAGPHIAHDTVYGIGYQTGIGSQWQDGAKVGIWPMYLDTPSEAYWNAALTDQYGNWNFEYTGTKDIVLPVAWFLE